MTSPRRRTVAAPGALLLPALFVLGWAGWFAVGPGAAVAKDFSFDAPRETGMPVDLELILAVDVSMSMDPDEQVVQKRGYVQGITSADVLKAIAEGVHGRIAVAYVEWAGSNEQRTLVDWHVIDDAASAEVFAGKIAEAPMRRAFRTSISGAIDFASRLFENNGYVGLRKVIDISGDGPNNQGRLVTFARDDAVESGITINGLPLMLKRPSSSMMDINDLDRYYRDCVVGGPGAFTIPVRDSDQFPEAIRRKLVLEIAGIMERLPSVIPAQGAPLSSCAIGERLWNDRMGN